MGGAVDAAVGAAVGLAVGAEVEIVVGDGLGTLVGGHVGAAVGPTVGSGLGTNVVGATDGEPLTAVGRAEDGAVEGGAVGVGEGVFVGAVGATVNCEGGAVGAAVGVGEGAVGATVNCEGGAVGAADGVGMVVMYAGPSVVGAEDGGNVKRDGRRVGSPVGKGVGLQCEPNTPESGQCAGISRGLLINEYSRVLIAVLSVRRPGRFESHLPLGVALGDGVGLDEIGTGVRANGADESIGTITRIVGPADL